MNSFNYKNMFYGDIFRIEDKGCLLFGNGKTKAGRVAITNENDEIALDLSLIVNKDNVLFGGFTIPGTNKSDNQIEIRYLIRMLNPEETEIYTENLKIESVTLSHFIELSQFNINFGSDKNRIGDFKEMIQNYNVDCIIVPWMSSHEEKGKMLRSNIEFRNIKEHILTLQ